MEPSGKEWGHVGSRYAATEADCKKRQKKFGLVSAIEERKITASGFGRCPRWPTPFKAQAGWVGHETATSPRGSLELSSAHRQGLKKAYECVGLPELPKEKETSGFEGNIGTLPGLIGPQEGRLMNLSA